MARIQETRRFDVAATAADVLSRLAAVDQTYGCRVVRADSNEVEVKRGSQVEMRVLGFMAPTNRMPVVAAVRVTPSGPQRCTVDLNALDDIGFGLRTGVKKKFAEAVVDLADLLTAAASGVLGPQVGVRPAGYCRNCGEAHAAGASFCRACGAALG